MDRSNGISLIDKYNKALLLLTAEENNEWHRVHERMRKISEAAREKNVGFLVDAEETWIQDPIDALTMLMMDEYNKEKAVIYNTIQLYRNDRLEFLKKSYDACVEREFYTWCEISQGCLYGKGKNKSDGNRLSLSYKYGQRSYG